MFFCNIRDFGVKRFIKAVLLLLLLLLIPVKEIYRPLEWIRNFYSLIAFDERVTFWLQRAWTLPCACAYVALFVRRLAYNHNAITLTMQQMYMQKAVARHVEAIRLLSSKPIRV